VLQSVRRPSSDGVLVERAAPRFAEDQALPSSPRTFSGYRLSRVLRVPGDSLPRPRLAESVWRCRDAELHLVILARSHPALEKRSVDASCFDLSCTPAINLFPKRGISVDLKREQSEYHVVPDKVKVLDFEVYQLEEVVGVGSEPGKRPRFLPFYFSTDRAGQHAAFYNTYRIPRRLTDRERRYGEASEYFGTDLYIALVDAEAAPYSSDLNALEISALCTNRHLPIQLSLGAGPTDFTMDLAGPLKSVQCLARTEPRPSLVDGEVAWKVLSHFSLNCRPLLEAADELGGAALQELLKVYADPADPQVLAQIRGIRSAWARTVLRRLPGAVDDGGLVSFGRGLEVTVGFDETPFAGTGAFLLGAVLEQFFARYVSLNSFTETVIRTEQRGEIMRWTR
jgi:type VI secretion system protein ImpG